MLPQSSQSRVLTGVIAALVLAMAPPAFAVAGAPLDWATMSMQLFGGLALFLLGMEMMAGALKVAAGDRIKLILATREVLRNGLNLLGVSAPEQM